MRRFPLPAAAFVLILARPAHAAEPWEKLAPLSEPRYQADLVSSGGFLYLMGGTDVGVSPIASVSAYDPRTNSWRERSPMPTPRWSFAAGSTHGRIFAAGGMTSGTAGGTFATALDVYDPVRDSWSRGSAMPSIRNMLGTVMGGKLYVAGGNDHGQCTSRSEVYDPAADSWSVLPPMPTARCSIAAAAYAGRLYVLGGTDTSGRVIYSTIEIYDPRTNAWTTGPPMPTPRGTLSAVALNGRIYALGGALGAGYSPAVESFDPAAGEWSIHAPLPTARCGAAAAAADGKIYLAGGLPDSGPKITDLLVYDPHLDHSIRRVPVRPPEAVASAAPDPWQSRASFSGPREQAALIPSDGSLYLIGGWDGSGALRSVSSYDPKADAWTARAPMPTARWLFAAGAAAGRLYAAGGMVDGSGLTSALQSYDPSRDVWSLGSEMPSSRNMDGAVLDGKLYVAGGNDHGQCTARAEVYDPATGSWSELPSLPTARCGAATAAYGGRLYVLGGTDTSGSVIYTTVDVYDPGTNAWSAGPSMPTPHRYFSAAVLDGRIYALGGSLARGFSTAVESLDPASGWWSIHAPLPSARCTTSAAVLDGKLYLAGGRLDSGKQVADLLVYEPRLDRSMRRAPPPPPDMRAVVRARPPRAVAPAPPAPPDVDGVASRPGSRPDDFALIVGIDGYRGLPHAAYGEGDASAFATYAHRVLGVPEENVILLTGQKATRTDIAKYIEEWLPRNVSKDSRVYFYYSGHGAPDPAKGTAYLLPWDGDPEFLQTSAYPLSQLYDQLDALPAKDVIVILDSCFSGAGGRSLIAKNLRPLVTVVATPRPGHKLSLLTASAGDEVAGSSDEKRHGLFTYYLLKGLQGDADVERTGHVGLDELHAYVEKNVLRAAHRENREQHPKLETSHPRLRLY